ncbi:META domain-containing protein [Roseobacter sp. EG26]|uniref:META domain-containing protein n=1 Tax=Roseobacter sp. EG26 TaxID=3412477 RepID=UPI003CE45EE3
MIHPKMIFPALISLIALAGCRPDETVSAYGAAGKTWQLVELNGQTVDQIATLTFPEEGRIAGEGPCNSYSAAMTVPYPWFEAGPIASTRRACPDLDFEADYFTALSEMTLSEVLGDTLILSTPEGAQMVFKSGA